MRLDFHRNHRLLFGTVLGVFFGLTLIVAIAPAWWVQTNNEPLPGDEPLTPLELEGLQVYVSEGCVYCHTQQVRPLPQDTSRYGRASAPADYAGLRPTDVWRQTPSILGTERTGPDLSNIGQRQPSSSWQHMHLYQPRAVVEGSIMPAFPWLYRIEAEPDSGDVVVPLPPAYTPDGGRVVTTRRADALVAYLLSLRQASLPGTGETATASGTATPTDGGTNGARVYANRCASCHQPDGTGVDGIYPPLVADPVVTNDDPREHVRIVLYGLEGSSIGGVAYAVAMPPWADQLTDEAVAAVVNHERTSWGNEAPTVTPQGVAAVRREGPTP